MVATETTHTGYEGGDKIVLVLNDPHNWQVASFWNARTETVKECFMFKFLEFLTGPERVDVFNRLYSRLKPDAKVHIEVPYYSHPQGFSNPFLAWPPISEFSFLYLSKKWRDEKPDHATPEITCDLEISNYEYDMESGWSTRHDSARSFAMQHYLGVATKLVINLVKPSVEV